jgi:hypothetical protein
LYSNIDGFDMDKKYWNVILDLPIEDKGEIWVRDYLHQIGI